METLKRQLAAAGNGARALVAAEPQFNAKIGHVFNVSYEDGLKFFDAEKQPGGVDFLHQLTDPWAARQSMKIWFYRTGGPDMLP